ncbi:unnamed protein product [Rotaria sp. Silwood2]|nr:unnamed protein product [Rotaria sp. Silwood2]CAF3003435.1 unnamed protein product [Rotaria sp. Silwood2]CAF3158955.1 unnamed protein product [Rotaria sp. Silwood2]CAF3305474.1 unnamed protein product [Rotaria sp. Silwood2]CAF4021771.1 unnamed protein product [Rotaria sp. Silwood2]
MTGEGYFKSGDWTSRYQEYSRWHGPHQMSLEFDHTTGKVIGHGYDDVGSFNVGGTFSIEKQQIILSKTYTPGGGDSKENIGHTITMKLTWNSSNVQFEGNWRDETDLYRNEDKFELKLGD